MSEGCDIEWVSAKPDAAAACIDKLHAGIGKLKADRAEAKHYAAALYAITKFGLNWCDEERAALADAIVACQRKRGLID